MEKTIKVYKRETMNLLRYYPACPFSKLLLEFKPQRFHPKTRKRFEKTFTQVDLETIRRHGFEVIPVPEGLDSSTF
jgi:hypothetical protein